MRILLASLEGYMAGDIALLVRGKGFTVERADNQDDALRSLKYDHFDVILFGGGEGVMGGMEFIRRLRASGNALPAIAVARKLDGRVRGRLLDCGADDVVDFPCDTEELCARLRAVVRRTRGFARSVLSVGPLQMHMDARMATAHGQDLRLSPSEYKVLELLTLRKGSVVPKTALMDLLYGQFDEPDIKSLNVLMHRLRKRLDSAELCGIVRTVWGTGYMVDEPSKAMMQMPMAAIGREAMLAA